MINDPLRNNRYLFSKEPVGFEKYTLSQAVRAIFAGFEDSLHFAILRQSLVVRFGWFYPPELIVT